MSTPADPETLNRVARAIARGLGDDYDHAFASKSEWADARGIKGGRSRDVNEPMQHDYDSAAEEAMAEMARANIGGEA